VRGIDRSLVDEVWQELTSYPPGRVEREAGAFLAQQPHVAAFAREMTAGLDLAVQRAAFGLCFLVFKVLERSLGRPFPTVAEVRVAAAYGATRQWIEGPAGGDPARVLAAAESPEHPSLAGYVLAVFYGGPGASHDYDEGVRASLHLLLGTLTEALDLGAPEG